MARKQYKTTGFTRFFLFMLFLVPATVLGVQLFKTGSIDVSKEGLISLFKDEAGVPTEVKIERIDKKIMKLEQQIEELKTQRDQLTSTLQG